MILQNFWLLATGHESGRQVEPYYAGNSAQLAQRDNDTENLGCQRHLFSCKIRQVITSTFPG